MNKFSIREAISSGWRLFLQNWKLLLLAQFVITAVQLIPSLILPTIFGNKNVVADVFSIGIWIVLLLATIGYIKMTLDIVDGKAVTIKVLFTEYRLFLKYLGGMLLVVFIVSLGLIFLVIPGIFLAIRLQLWQYYILEGAGPIEALKKSWTATKGSMLRLVELGLVLLFVNVLGLMVIGLGLIVTGPVTALAMASVYRKLAA